MESAPLGTFSIWADDVTVHGTRQRAHDRDRFIRGVLQAKKSGDVFGVQLIREPDNPHDHLAVAVHGFWRDSEGSSACHLGYVPRKLSFKISIELGGLLYSALSGFRKTNDGFDILIHILEKE